jgi:hypothetical protein
VAYPLRTDVSTGLDFILQIQLKDIFLLEYLGFVYEEMFFPGEKNLNREVR